MVTTILEKRGLNRKPGLFMKLAGISDWTVGELEADGFSRPLSSSETRVVSINLRKKKTG